MAAELTINETTPVAKGTVIFEKGDELTCVALVLKGRVAVRSSGILVTLGSGNFLGICDVLRGEHSFTYVAGDGVTVYPLPVNDVSRVKKLIEGKAQYRGLLVTSQNFLIRDLNKSFKKLQTTVHEMRDFLIASYATYQKEAQDSGVIPQEVPSLARLEAEIIEDPKLPSGVNYYLEAASVEVEAQRAFLGSKSLIAFRHYMEQCELFPPLIDGCRIYGEWVFKFFRSLIMDEKNLFTFVTRTALDIKKAGQKNERLSALVDELIAKIDEVETVLIETVGTDPKLNRTHMQALYMALLSDDIHAEVEIDEQDLSVLNGSVTQIIEYSGVDEEVGKAFRDSLDAFMRLTDKFGRTKDAMAVRKKVTEPFFAIYEAAVKRSFSDPKPPLAVSLFLTYGFASEELLTEEDLRTLISLPDIGAGNLDCHIYTMAEWLKEIYEGRKLPSKDEFDEDYEEHVRKDHAKDRRATQEAMNNADAKLHFEIDNLFKYADRLISGNISTFVPVLCSEGILTTLSTAAVTGAAINAAVRKVEKVDYSIFFREIRSFYEEIDLNNFTNIDRYTPDFILFPVCGGGCQMWQDIEGKVKTTHARILMPTLSESGIDGMVLKMMAHFRWEKCRTDMGANWNNYRYPSLTSEYTDYLQFYKKNSDLSPEKKEKVKAQLTQAGNRHRDVFTKDYTDWILKEAVGAMRLNKVSRDILFTYCPISQEISAGLVTQTSYADAAKRHTMEQKKLEKNLTNVMHKFTKNGVDIPPEIEKTRKFLLEA
ncbi:MAG: cyclic nucleotide-binding domain-containing protein [Eubacterium sp.]|nr:cyclic nucleotide-binding domain-containing protein [Eubacterium sp.]